MFVKVVDRTANDLNVTWNNLLLGQVALIPDLIESTSHMASSRADAIKTQNGSEMVRQLAFMAVCRIEIATSEEERLVLEELSSRNQYVATLLPIRIDGVKGDCRTYSYCVELSSDPTQPNWNDLASYARLIQRVCHNVNRVCYVFGKPVRESVTDVTPTYLTSKILVILREADYLANKILRDSGCSEKLAQMPIVLIPFTFIAIRVNAFHHVSDQSFFDHSFHRILLLDFLQFPIPTCPKRFLLNTKLILRATTVLPTNV
ncbi:hypothetical protein OUZ56_002666 [Daphnia magna]|uniref:GMP synthase n=1 Tax=Daphnia magna TaxID=35525 RepID=A0ABR0A6E7_9CRUS|nr:hypothetical protein OUZ56_002666 [Daphnia magna]